MQTRGIRQQMQHQLSSPISWTHFKEKNQTSNIFNHSVVPLVMSLIIVLNTKIGAKMQKTPEFPTIFFVHPTTTYI